MKKHLALTLTFLTLYSCATSPLGRKQYTIVPDSEMNQMGAQAFEDMKATKTIERDPRTVAYIQCLAKNITEQVKDEIDPASWEVVTFRDKAVNAFALPGGKIGVYTGIIPVAKTPSQLAAVMGHEVAHVIARHGNERVSQAMTAELGMSIAGVKQKSYGFIIQLLAGGGLMAFSREHESEADIIGLHYMAKAGFDPRESVTLWQNMAKASGGRSAPEILSTHPSNETRIKQLQERMPEAMQMYEHARSQGKNPGCDQI